MKKIRIVWRGLLAVAIGLLGTVGSAPRASAGVPADSIQDRVERIRDAAATVGDASASDKPESFPTWDKTNYD